jgi:tetratricopeptide (TPR) repeat protein
MTGINFHGYNLAKLQFSLKKYDEAYQTIQKVEKINDTGKYKITFVINQNHNQQVELLAAVFYLKGITEIELELSEAAKASFEKAIKIQPDFILVKEQLEGLK